MFSPKRLLLLSLLAIGLAAVTVTNIATGATREAAAGDDGDFAFLSLPPGKYRVEVSARGFKRTVVEELDVNVTQTSTVNLKLEPSIQEETVTVTAEGTLVQQESSQVGRVIESRPISQLPLPTRNFQQLLTLSPGTSASGRVPEPPIRNQQRRVSARDCAHV